MLKGELALLVGTLVGEMWGEREAPRGPSYQNVLRRQLACGLEAHSGGKLGVDSQEFSFEYAVFLVHVTLRDFPVNSCLLRKQEVENFHIVNIWNQAF